LIKLIRKILKRIKHIVILLCVKISGPPRLLTFTKELNADILRMFGAKIGKNKVRILSPVVLHEAKNGYSNLTIEDGCYVNGNNFLDLSSRIILERGVSIGPGVIIMTHNSYNFNKFLEEHLAHTCGKKEVRIKEGAGIKAGALIVKGVTIGKNTVVAGNAVVNRDVGDNCFVAGVPARLIKEIK